jgi:hypothetical protein
LRSVDRTTVITHAALENAEFMHKISVTCTPGVCPVAQVACLQSIYFVCFEHTRKNRDCKWKRIPGESITVFGPVC